MNSTIIQLPFKAGRIALARDAGRLGFSWEREGCASRHPLDRLFFESRLSAKIFDRHGRLRGRRFLGSGLVTNVGVMAMANDYAWSASLNLSTLGLSNNHSSGTGATAAAATDIKLQTPITTVAAAVVAGVQSLISAANLQKYQTVATISYDAGGPYAVTEWSLFSNLTLSAATGSPFTAGTATSGTVTGTPLTASSPTVRGNQQFIAERTSGTNLSYGLVLSNSTSVFTVPAWYLVATGAAGQAPANTETFVIRPVMWDHKVFSAINVNNGDSIQYTYQLTINSGG